MGRVENTSSNTKNVTAYLTFGCVVRSMAEVEKGNLGMQDGVNQPFHVVPRGHSTGLPIGCRPGVGVPAVLCARQGGRGYQILCSCSRG